MKISNGVKKYILFSIIFFGVLFFAKASWAANWYVDNAATGSNNGTSWTNAWTALRFVVWGASGVKEGDTLYISGGTTSKTYNITSSEYLNVGVSGTSANRIYIRPGQDAGHNGVVILDGALTYHTFIRGIGRSYITINGEYNGSRHLRLQNSRTDGDYSILNFQGTGYGNKFFYIEIATAGSGINLINNTKGTGDNDQTEVAYSQITGIVNEVAIAVYGSTAVSAWNQILIHHNTIQINNPWTGSGTGPDGIQGTRGTSVYNNHIYAAPGSVAGSTQHQDLIQALGTQWKIYNNTFENTGNAIIKHSSSDGANSGHIHIYNNTLAITSPSVSGYQRAFEMGCDSPCTHVSDIRIYHNTIIDLYGFQGIYFGGNAGTGVTMSDMYIVNNIIYNIGGPVINYENKNYICGAWGSGAGVVIDYNLINAGAHGQTDISCDGSSFTQTHGQTGAPSFMAYRERAAANDFHLSPSDTVARDRGVDLSAINYLAADKDGVTRPQGTAWDIGAYEYAGAGLTTYTFTVAKSGTGSGTVSGTGIACGSDCAETVNSGTSIILSASPASGSTFVGWSGACSGAGTCTITLTSNTTVTATFNTTAVLSSPTISIQPQPQTAIVGNTATFSVTASGNPTPTYQWQKNNVNISAATNPTYTTPALLLSDSGSTYRVIVSNSQGSLTSNSATLTVTSAPSSLVAYWKFDETSGITASDSSGNNNIGTLVNDPSWITGRINNALSFDGSNDYVSLPSVPSGTDFTITAWVRPAAFSDWGTIAAESNNNGLFTYTGGVFDIYDGASCLSSVKTPNQWYLVTVTRTASAKLLYLNAILDKTCPAGSAWSLRYIGSDNLNEAFNGLIDEVRIYNRALSPSEISQLYNYTGSVDTTPPAAPTGIRVQ